MLDSHCGRQTQEARGLKVEVSDNPLAQDESVRTILEGMWRKIGLLVFIFLTGTVILSIFFRIPILIPTPWTTAIYYLYLAPILLYSFSVMVRPWIVMSLCFPALVLGEVLWCILYGTGGELLINVILALNGWGLGCLLISILRNKNILLVLPFGALWSFIGILIPTAIYYEVILHWNLLYMVAYSLFSMIFNLILVPPALVLVYTIRKTLKVQNLEELFPHRERPS
jgi:hypothetical protein